MKNLEFTPDVVDFAWQIITMDKIIKDQAKEIERLHGLEEELNTLVNSSF